MSQKPRVVYVDDDLSNLSHYKKMLLSEFEMDTYVQSNEFLKNLEHQDYDCYIFDLYMPIWDGFQLLEKVRQHPEKSKVPVFIITSSPSDESRVNSFKSGAVDFLDRLAKKDELIARIDARIKNFKENQTHLKLGNLKINMNKMSSELDGVTLDLTLVEYKIITSLSKCFPLSITKSDLVSFIWGDIVQSDNNLNTHIYNLRKKVANWDFEISNHRTQGFSLTKK